MIRSREQLQRHLTGGGLLRCEYIHLPEPKTIWSDPETNQAVHATAAKWFVKNGKLAPEPDGLFPEVAQTYRLAAA